MASDLYIDGALIDRAAARVTLNRLALSLDAPDCLEFAERGTVLPGAYTCGATCSLYVDGVPRFLGQIRGRYPSGVGRGPIDIGYRALGCNWLANRIAITGTDGTGRVVYNLPSTDDYYVASQSGLSVGQILTNLFTLHWSQLQAAGVTSFSAVQLAALTVVPPEPVVITGRLWNAVTELLAVWCNKYAAWIDGFGAVQVQSQLAFASRTIVLDNEPAILDQISQDTSECFTRVAIRGGAWIEGAYLSVDEGTLGYGQTAADAAAWSLSDFYSPKGSADAGAISSQTSTTLTLVSDDTSKTFGVNALSAVNAEVWCYDPAATGITFQDQRRVTANTALSAGGTYTVTVDSPFSASGYRRYQIRGRYAAAALTWRKLVPVSTYVGMHLAPRFSHSFGWHPSDGAVTQTDAPVGNIVKNGVEIPFTFDIVPSDGVNPGYLVAQQPVVKAFGTIANLTIGGSSTDGIPDDIKVLVPYSKGTLTAVWPADSGGVPQYGGTAYTSDGVAETCYYDVPDWLDYHDQANLLQLAREKFDTLSNTVTEGSLTYFSKYSDLLTLGTSINIGKAEGTTGYETIAAPIRSVVLDYSPDGGPVPHITRIQFSNRLRPFAGDRLYAHPIYGGQASALAGGPNLFGISGPSTADMAAMAGQIRTAGPADPTAVLANPTAALADPTGGGVDPLSGSGVWTPNGGSIADAADWGIGGPGQQGRGPITQADRIARDQQREFTQGMAAMDREMKRINRPDPAESMKRLNADPDFPLAALTQ